MWLRSGTWFSRWIEWVTGHWSRRLEKVSWERCFFYTVLQVNLMGHVAFKVYCLLKLCRW